MLSHSMAVLLRGWYRCAVRGFRPPFDEARWPGIWRLRGQNPWARCRACRGRLGLERFQHFIRRDRHLVDAHAERVVNRVGDGGDNGVEWSLARLFATE